jgi:predicted Rossmann-fold nucleotide-binding protein
LEEVLEVLTLKQLGLHTKPIVFLNTQGFFQPLQLLFEELYRQRFARQEYESLYAFADSPAEAVTLIRKNLSSGLQPAVTKWT